MKIVKITFEDGSENEFKELPLENFVKPDDKHSGYAKHRFKKQREDWEEDYIIDNLEIDVEDYAKERYDLVDDVDEKELSDFSDRDLLSECKSRNIPLQEIGNESIINENFIERIIEISRRGDDNYINSVLETLEKLYRIK
ncbi:MAG: hypothetical protein ACOH1X_02765 [Kaistella sp.]